MRGDYQLLFAAPEAYESVTRADVARIARQVFNPDKRTVGVLLPSGGEEPHHDDDGFQPGAALR